LIEGCADNGRAGAENFFQEASVECAGGDSVDVDVVWPEFLGQRFRKAHDGSLGGGIGADHGKRLGRAAAGQIDDFAAPLLLEVGDDGASGQHHAVKIDFDGALPFAPVYTLARAFRAIDSGVVNKNLYRTERCDGGGRKLVDSSLVGDIAGKGEYFLAGGSASAQFLCCAVELGDVAGADGDAGASKDVVTGDFEAEPLAGACDDGVEAGEFHRAEPTVR
jgi:hypothetical protein